MKKDIHTCIPLDDTEYMLNFSEGYHSHGAKEFPIDTIRIGYPIADWGKGEYRTFPVNLTDGATIGCIMLTAARIIYKEIEKGNNYAPHIWSDYTIEHITILDNVATIECGS